MNDHQSKDFLSNTESKYGDALCYMEVQWLSHGQMLRYVWFEVRNWIFSANEGETFPSTLWLWLYVWLCILHWHHSTHEWTEHKSTRSKSPYQWNVWQNNNVWEGAFNVGNATVIKRYSSQFWERKSSLMLRDMWKEFSFFNKNSTPIFKIYACMRPQSTYFQCHLTLSAETVRAKLKWRWQKYILTCSFPWLL